MRRVVVYLFALFVLLTAYFALPVSAAETSGTCGDNVIWNYDTETKTLTVSGQGAMKDYPASASEKYLCPWYCYRNELKTIIIEPGVTYLGNSTFYFNSALTSVSIPDTVTRIGQSVFSSCTALKEITIPDSVTEIGYFSFSGCTALERVKLSNSMTVIPYRTFQGCKSLKEIELHEGLTLIDKEVFEDCASLTAIDFPQTLTKIDSSAFSGCVNLINVVIPTSVQSLGGDVFRECKRLANVVFLGSAPSTRFNEFYNTHASVYYPSGDASWTEQVKEKMGSGFVLWFGVEDPSQVKLPQPGDPLEGRCGENAYWKLDQGVLTVYGTGSADRAPWEGFASQIITVVVEDGITSLCGASFSHFGNLTKVTISSRGKQHVDF